MGPTLKEGGQELELTTGIRLNFPENSIKMKTISTAGEGGRIQNFTVSLSFLE